MQAASKQPTYNHTCGNGPVLPFYTQLLHGRSTTCCSMQPTPQRQPSSPPGQRSASLIVTCRSCPRDRTAAVLYTTTSAFACIGLIWPFAVIVTSAEHWVLHLAPVVGWTCHSTRARMLFSQNDIHCKLLFRSCSIVSPMVAFQRHKAYGQHSCQRIRVRTTVGRAVQRLHSWLLTEVVAKM